MKCNTTRQLHYNCIQASTTGLDSSSMDYAVYKDGQMDKADLEVRFVHRFQ